MVFCCLGALLCVIGLLVAVIVSTMDKIGMRRLGQESVIQEESSKMVGRTLIRLQNCSWHFVVVFLLEF